jgi:hypothetical protein
MGHFETPPEKGPGVRFARNARPYFPVTLLGSVRFNSCQI